jgi:4,5-dihydroxyphthalate decarboxylase
VPEWQMTATVWLRGFLQDDHGVRVQDVSWLTERVETSGRKEKVPLQLPPDIRVEQGNNLSAMLVAGEIDALMTAQVPGPDVKRVPEVRRLLPLLVRSNVTKMIHFIPQYPGPVTTSTRSKQLIGHDYWPYGVELNRKTLEIFLRYCQEQGLSNRNMEVDELFAHETLDVTTGERADCL